MIFSYGPTSLMGTWVGVETSPKYVQNVIENGLNTLICLWSYCTAFPDLETPYGTANGIGNTIWYGQWHFVPFPTFPFVFGTGTPPF